MDEASQIDLPGTAGAICELKSSNENGEDFKCPVCEKKFGSKKNMKSHLTRHSTTGSFPCDVCGRIYTDKRTLENHTKRFNGECVPKPNVPPKCIIVQPVQLKKGGKEQKPKTVTTFKCPDCDYVGKKKEYYRAHRKNAHSEPGCFKCPVCENMYVSERKMRRHLARHSTTGSFPCNVCGFIYNDKRTLIRHEEKHKEGWVQKTLSCTQCSKTFISTSGLKFHIESHSQAEGKYLCSICGKRFRQKSSFDEHYNVLHLKIKPFVCDICGKRFGYRMALKDHKLLHSEEKTHVCPICSKAFRQKTNLFTHSKTHKSTKDYHCRICGKEFTQRSSLLRHGRVHSGEKPFVCKICDNRFSDSSIIRRHMILIHKQDAKGSRWKIHTHEEMKNPHQLMQEEVNGFMYTKS